MVKKTKGTKEKWKIEDAFARYRRAFESLNQVTNFTSSYSIRTMRSPSVAAHKDDQAAFVILFVILF